MYGQIQAAFDHIGKLLDTPKEQLEAAFEQQQAAQEAQFQQLMVEARLRLIERFRSMKTEYPDNPAIQQLCDKQLAQLEAEETGA